ncbi:MAG: hypothetical protein II879_00715 [Clostridia bacterium]|nr:hypothetical protein [Clostridia bacterium]
MSDAENHVREGAKNASQAGSDTDNARAAQAERLNKCHFSGAFVHGVDSKGRMIIPANFRDALGDRFVVALTPDFQNVAIYPMDEWLNQQDKLEALAELDARVLKLIEQFNKYSYTDCETDQQGRLLLPQKMRAKYLDNCREVEISGAKKYIRILKSEAGAAEDDTFRTEFPDPLAFLADVQRSARPRND